MEKTSSSNTTMCQEKAQTTGFYSGLLDHLTLEEKLHLLIGASAFRSYPVERLGIPAIQYLDGGTGINFEQLMSDVTGSDTGTTRAVLEHFNEPEALTDEQRQIHAGFIEHLKERQSLSFSSFENGDTSDKEVLGREVSDKDSFRPELPGCYPPGILLGSTWNPEVIYECGAALGEEAALYRIDILLGTPNVNLHRDPRNGRLFEGYSEDPFLVSTLAPQLVLGVQSKGVLANVKHFAANNLEAYRQGIDETIPLRALHELYLPGFKACVTKGHVKTLMTAYNKINGIACTENHTLIQDILRNEWGFDDGLVISDWGAVYNQVAALSAGNDIQMPGPQDISALMSAVQSGDLKMEAVDTAVSHMLHTIDLIAENKQRLHRAELNTSNLGSSLHESTSTNHSSSSHREAAYHAITEGAVLLKNKDHALPLSSNSRIACIGKDSVHYHDCGDGSARVCTDKTSSICDYLDIDQYESVSDISYGNYDYVIYTAYVSGQEGRDRKELALSEKQQADITTMLNHTNKTDTRTILILNVCGPVDLRFCEKSIDAILCIFFPGMEGGHGVADLLSGKVNPSGKLPVTFPKRLEDIPTYLNVPEPDWSIHYGEGLYVGYRYYDKKDIEPMYPFGYGLSYSSFRIDNIHCEQSHIHSHEKHSNLQYELFCDVENTGDYAGSEVIQLYVNQINPTLDKPLRELKGFHKIFLKPGEKQTVSFIITEELLASFNPVYNMWATEPGSYNLYLGTSSRNLESPVTIVMSGSDIYTPGKNTPLIQILDNSILYAEFLKQCEKFGITESDFQSHAIYGPYFSLETVLDCVLQWKNMESGLEDIKSEIYNSLAKIYKTIEK